MPKINFENIEEVRNEKEEQKKKYDQEVTSQVDSTKMIHGQYNRRRYTRKAELAQLVTIWREELKDDSQVLRDKKLKQLLNDIEEYVNLDVTATHGTTMNQLDDVNRVYITAKMKTWSESGKLAKLFEETKEYLRRTEERLEKEENPEKVKVLGQRLLMAENINLFLEDQVTGFLPPPPKGAYHIKGNDKNTKTLSFMDGLWDYRDKPLFPHDPSVSDVRQGLIGDCYMAAAIAGAVRKDPDTIKEAIRDNGDGTVTVRFFRRIPTKGYPPTEEKKEMEPFYVTVDKTVPMGMGAVNSLWVALIEKAAVVSGIAMGRQHDKMFAQPVPENIDELYNKYKKLPQYLRPSKIECPWLYDDDGNFVKWQPQYEQIVGGFTEEFIETLLGTDYKGFSQDMNRIRNNAATDVSYDYMMILLQRASSKEFADKVRVVLEAQEKPEKRMENAYYLLRAVKTSEIDYKTYQPTLNNRDELEGLGKRNVERSYRNFAQAIEETVEEVLYESNINYKTADEFANQMENKIKEKVRKVTNYSAEEERNIDQFLTDLTQDKNLIAEGISGRTYPLSYIKQYEEIKNELEKGHIVGVSSPYDEKGDDKAAGGIIYQHAYSVIGVEEENIGGKDYKFVIVRNPHGKNFVPKYDYTYTPPKALNGKDIAAEGIFRMELSHFMSNMGTLDFNGKELSKDQNSKNFEKITNVAMTRHYSKYIRLFSVIDKDLTKALKNVEAESSDMEEFKRSIEDLIGKSGDNPQISKFGIIGTYSRKILENEKLDPTIQQILKTSKKLYDMFDRNVEDPIAEIGEGISGYPMTTKETLYDFFDLDMQNEFSHGVEFGEKEAKNILVILKKANSDFVTSSKQFKDMSEGVKKFSIAFKALREEANEKNMEVYVESLKELGEASKAYLDFKAEQRMQSDGSIKYKSKLEKTRVDAAKKIMEYAISKSQKLEKSYVNMVAAQKIQNILFPDKETKLQDYTVMDTVKSDEFQTAVEGKTIEELKKLLQDKQQIKLLAEKYNSERLKNVVRPVIAYRSDARRQFKDIFDNKFSTEEEKINAAAKYVYGHMVWVADTKGNISEKAVYAEEKNFIERIKKETVFQSYLKDLDRQWVTSGKNDNRLEGVRREIDRSLRLTEGKTLESILRTKTTEIQKREEQLQKEEELKNKEEKKVDNVDNEMKDEEPEMGGL